MTKHKPTYDVFIVCDIRDADIANSIADVLHSHDLVVFTARQFPAGTNIEDATWEAMSESGALVVVLPDKIDSAWHAFELGAAKAWNKPIYAVSGYNTHRDLPPIFREISIFPPTRVDEIAQSIRVATHPLSKDDIMKLGAAYAATGLPVDQLLLQPQQLAKLVKLFNKQCDRQMAGEQVMWHLLRLRKSGQLPAITKKH